MALRQIRIMGDEKLEKVCRPLKQVTDRDRELIQDMLDTMYDANGVGLAAPQVRRTKSVIVLETEQIILSAVQPDTIARRFAATQLTEQEMRGEE